jgi:hypothetical protein
LTTADITDDMLAGRHRSFTGRRLIVVDHAIEKEGLAMLATKILFPSPKLSVMVLKKAKYTIVANAGIRKRGRARRGERSSREK